MALLRGGLFIGIGVKTQDLKPDDPLKLSPS